MRPNWELTADLRAEHDAIRAALDRARALGPSSPEGRAALLDARHLMKSHLDKEEALVYPALRAAAASDPELAVTLQVLGVEGARVRDAIASLYWRLEAGEQGLHVARDLGRVRGLLLERQTREENVLYPEYDRVRLSGGAAPAAPRAADPPARRAAGIGA